MKRFGLVLVGFAISVSAALAQSRVSDVIYMKQAGAAFTLDVFKPAKPTGAAVIHLVSGGWVSDHANINPALSQLATDRGITVIQVVHGAQPRYKVPEIAQQVARAVRFVRANAATYGIDPNRIGITGGSAGGHLSLLTAATAKPGNPNSKDPVDQVSSNIQAVAVFFPPTDFSNWGKDGAYAFDNPLLKGVYGNAFVADIKMAPAEQVKTISVQMSPINFFTATMPPTLIVHGDKDALVPIQQSQVAIKKLESLGVKCELITVAGKDHGWPEMPVQFLLMMQWFEKYLK